MKFFYIWPTIRALFTPFSGKKLTYFINTFLKECHLLYWKLSALVARVSGSHFQSKNVENHSFEVFPNFVCGTYMMSLVESNREKVVYERINNFNPCSSYKLCILSCPVCKIRPLLCVLDNDEAASINKIKGKFVLHEGWNCVAWSVGNNKLHQSCILHICRAERKS